MTNAWVAIGSQTLASSTATVTFGSIPQVYRDLIIAISCSTSTGQGVKFQYNGETATTNYSRVFMYGNGSTAASSASSGDANAQKVIQTNGTISTALIQIIDYSATDKHKTILARSGPANDLVFAEAQRWASTSAITSIAIISENSFAAGSTLTLYGSNRL